MADTTLATAGLLPNNEIDIEEKFVATYSAVPRVLGFTQISLGGIGLLGAVISAIGFLVAIQGTSPPAGLSELNYEIINTQTAIANKFLAAGLFSVMVHVPLAVGLILAGIAMLHRRSRNFVANISIGLIAFEAARLILQIAQAVMTYSAVTPLFDQLDFPEGFEWSFNFIFAASLLTSMVYALLKIGFYGFTVHYLSKPAVREQFRETANVSPNT